MMAAVMVLSCECLKTVILNTRVGILFFWALALSFNLLFSLFHSEFPTKNNSLQSPQVPNLLGLVSTHTNNVFSYQHRSFHAL